VLTSSRLQVGAERDGDDGVEVRVSAPRPETILDDVDLVGSDSM
jgi:hypothetical protein